MKIIKRLCLYGVSLIIVASVPVSTFADSNPIVSSDTSPTSQAEVAPDSQSIGQTNQPESTPATSSTPSTDASITTANTSTAQTGDATVDSNGQAGNATTGSANSSQTVMTVVNSQVASASSAPLVVFNQDIVGNVTGDINVSTLMNNAALQQGGTSLINTIPTASSATSTIQNTVTGDAISGNATVSNNGVAGNATTGAANAQATIITIVNSLISSQKTFIGTINIFGNLNGDILLGADLQPQLMNAAAYAPVSGSNSVTIDTDVSLSATSGNAKVENNGSAGNATSGNATTNLVLYNLTGRQIVAANSVVVFVNVLGKWVGVILNAPSTTTSALVGTGVQEDTPTYPKPVATNASTAITNTVKMNAQSGNATVMNNQSAGNATTGTATASANILNVSQSSVGLSGWFAMLFINVFGNWYGSFGVNTPYGDPPTKPIDPPIVTDPPVPVSSFAAQPRNIPFVPSSTDKIAPNGSDGLTAQAQVLGSHTIKNNNEPKVINDYSQFLFWMLGVIAALALTIYFIVRRFIPFQSTVQNS